MWKSRSLELEIIDLGDYSEEEYRDCLCKLGQIGKWLGGDLATFKAFERMGSTPSSILDVGCGGGQFTTRLALRFPSARVLGIDLNPLAIEFAKEKLRVMKNSPKNLQFETRSQEKLDEEKKSFDVVTSTLVCHHLTDENLTDFIMSACHIAKKKVIINDLHRHPMALYLFKIVSPIFFRNRLIQSDGALSIRRAFIYDDWMHYLKKAGLHPSQYTLSWHLPFRWLLEIDCRE